MEFGGKGRIVFGINDAERDGAGVLLARGGGDFGGGEAGAELGDTPAKIRGQRTGHESAHFMKLARGCGDDQSGTALGAGEGFSEVAQEIAHQRGAKVFVGGGNFSVAPPFSNGFCQRRDDSDEHALDAEDGTGALQGLVKTEGVEFADGDQRFVEPGFCTFARGE